MYRGWTANRLGETEEVSYRESYWFSYISTTTVGLGDYILTPEVLVRRDLLVYPVLFLIGFTFFSAFIGKLAEMLGKPIAAKAQGLLDSFKKESNKPNEEPVNDTTSDGVATPPSQSNPLPEQSANDDQDFHETERHSANDKQKDSIKAENVLSGEIPSQDKSQSVNPFLDWIKSDSYCCFSQFSTADSFCPAKIK